MPIFLSLILKALFVSIAIFVSGKHLCPSDAVPSLSLKQNSELKQ